MQTLEEQPSPEPLSFERKVDRICKDLAKLDPGPLADLRRMDTNSDNYGAPFFWRLLSRYRLAASTLQEPVWAQIIQALAILTPKGRDDAKPSRHARTVKVDTDASTETSDASAQNPRSQRRGFGHVLCDGGDFGWPKDKASPKPVYSEARLAQLLGSSGATRIDMVLRTTRLLTTQLPAEAKFDCTDLVLLLLKPDEPSVGRKIARDYYERLDRARHTEADEKTDTSTGDAR